MTVDLLSRHQVFPIWPSIKYLFIRLTSHIILTKKIKNKAPDHIETLKTKILNFIKKCDAQPT
ncbi:hypothetical protein BDGGKGIB_01403 [Nodularia sphaerocarpa UHCC 0038]|nr:hypothetical protein BDGGKGIB_01403 [Nodularia sphaerocarpa UHCC 0038]